MRFLCLRVEKGITVITPTGTRKISDRSCNLVSDKTSFDFIAEALRSGYEEIKLRDRVRKISRKKNGEKKANLND